MRVLSVCCWIALSIIGSLSQCKAGFEGACLGQARVPAVRPVHGRHAYGLVKSIAVLTQHLGGWQQGVLPTMATGRGGRRDAQEAFNALEGFGKGYGDMLAGVSEEEDAMPVLARVCTPLYALLENFARVFPPLVSDCRSQGASLFPSKRSIWTQSGMTTPERSWWVDHYASVWATCKECRLLAQGVAHDMAIIPPPLPEEDAVSNQLVKDLQTLARGLRQLERITKKPADMRWVLQ